MIKDYKIASHNSTVCGEPGRIYDWTKFCWDGSELFQSVFKGGKLLKASFPWVDDFFIDNDCQYLHVPYRWKEQGTIYRVRPNETMRAGRVYRSKLIVKQTAVEKEDGWYWRLKYGD